MEMSFHVGSTSAGTTTYERQFAGCFPNHTQAFAFWKGRVALYAILESLGIGPGDEVILPGFTCVVVPNAVLYRGAMPVYVDIEGTAFTMDVRDIERKITSRTKAIIVQHTYGIPADMDGIKTIADRHGLPIIEDAPLAHGARYCGKRVGLFGQLACFSFYPSKNLGAYGEGGL